MSYIWSLVISWFHMIRLKLHEKKQKTIQALVIKMCIEVIINTPFHQTKNRLCCFHCGQTRSHLAVTTMVWTCDRGPGRKRIGQLTDITPPHYHVEPGSIGWAHSSVYFLPPQEELGQAGGLRREPEQPGTNPRRGSGERALLTSHAITPRSDICHSWHSRLAVNEEVKNSECWEHMKMFRAVLTSSMRYL